MNIIKEMRVLKQAVRTKVSGSTWRAIKKRHEIKHLLLRDPRKGDGADQPRRTGLSFQKTTKVDDSHAQVVLSQTELSVMDDLSSDDSLSQRMDTDYQNLAGMGLSKS